MELKQAGSGTDLWVARIWLQQLRCHNTKIPGNVWYQSDVACQDIVYIALSSSPKWYVKLDGPGLCQHDINTARARIDLQKFTNSVVNM